MGEGWRCPKPDCHEGIDAHPLAKFLDHLHYDEPKFTAQDAQEVADRVLARLDPATPTPPGASADE